MNSKSSQIKQILQIWSIMLYKAFQMSNYLARQIPVSIYISYNSLGIYATFEIKVRIGRLGESINTREIHARWDNTCAIPNDPNLKTLKTYSSHSKQLYWLTKKIIWNKFLITNSSKQKYSIIMMQIWYKACQHNIVPTMFSPYTSILVSIRPVLSKTISKTQKMISNPLLSCNARLIFLNTLCIQLKNQRLVSLIFVYLLVLKMINSNHVAWKTNHICIYKTKYDDLLMNYSIVYLHVSFIYWAIFTQFIFKY